jgi:hypothetical protein
MIREPKALPGRLRMLWTASSPKPRFSDNTAKAVPVEKTSILEGLRCFAGALPGGNKVLLTMFARQLFPS